MIAGVRTLAFAASLGKLARRITLAAGILACSALPALAADAVLSASDAALYRSALEAADADRWEEAHRLAGRAAERLPAKVVTWMQLADPSGGADFATIARFVRAHPDWPNLAALRRNAEMAIGPATDPQEIRAWFAVHPPLTGAGILHYATALDAAGMTAELTELVRSRWVQGGFGAREESDILSRFGRLLRASDHRARLDRLLWDGEGAAARRLLGLVDSGYRAVAEARLALADMRPGVDAAIGRVPASLADDPGLLYERMRWRRRSDQDAGAIEILLNRPAELGRPNAWWAEQHILARRAMERGDYALAYRLAAGHGQKDGFGFAQAEFLAGWLALRFLDRPADALRHFTLLHDGVSTPLSVSRGAYWAGRAAEALGRTEESLRWYGLAARHVTTFYGLLAAEKLGREKTFRLPDDPVVPAAASAAFLSNDMARLARMLNRISPDKDREAVFLRRFGSNAKTPAEFGAVARFALDMDRPDLAVWVAKQGVQNDVTLVEGGYPVIGPAAGTRHAAPVDPALVHSLIRQESTFNRRAVSPAGARGLMQLMPATAREVARRLGIRHDTSLLTEDPEHNIRLGSTYVREMLDRFGGSYILAIASYNAGPGRVAQWLERFGDPRSPAVDPIDWIEQIPIYETRNYVQRVMEGLYVYRARFDGGTYPLTLSADLRR